MTAIFPLPRSAEAFLSLRHVVPIAVLCGGLGACGGQSSDMPTAPEVGRSVRSPATSSSSLSTEQDTAAQLSSAIKKTVLGRVYDVETDKPVKGALVEALNQDKSSASGNRGKYKITGLQADRVTLKVTHPDYETSRSIVRLKRKKTRRNFYLDPTDSGSGNGVTMTVDLDKEEASIKNNASTNLSMTSWTLLSVVGGQRFKFPSFTLGGKATVTVTSGPDSRHNPPRYLRWSRAYVWNNDGDPGNLFDSTGKLVAKTNSSGNPQ